MKRLLIIFMILNFLCPSYGQDESKEIIDKFFEVYEKSPIEALDYVYGTSPYINEKGDAVKKLKGQLNQFIDLVGDYRGHEFIYTSELGKSYVTYIYLVKYDRQPVRFVFSLYKATDTWILYSFKFDDSFDKDFEEVMKYEYLRNKWN